MSQTIVLGAGGFAREVACYERIDAFTTDDESQWGKTIFGKPVVPFGIDGKLQSNLSEFFKGRILFPNFEFITGVGNPYWRKDFVRSIGEARFPPVFGQGIYSGKENVYEEGVIVCPGTTITTNVRIKKHAMVNINCTIGHDAVIGEYSVLCPGVHLSGYTSIGDLTELGTGVVVLPHVKIGNNCVIGAGAVVTKDIPDNSVAVGIPAKVIKSR